MSSPSLSTILRDHVTLSITSFDRLYLGGYLPSLQASGQLVTCCLQRLNAPIASPALFGPLTDRFIKAVQQFAGQHDVPVIHFVRGQRKDDVAARYRARFTANEGVVFIGIAQEKMNAFAAHKTVSQTGRVAFDFGRRSVAVNHVYFYVHDAEWGPAFIKIGTYLPFPVRIALNGHEWAKQQLCKKSIAFSALDNGFRWCAERRAAAAGVRRARPVRRPGILRALARATAVATHRRRSRGWLPASAEPMAGRGQLDAGLA